MEENREKSPSNNSSTGVDEEANGRRTLGIACTIE